MICQYEKSNESGFHNAEISCKINHLSDCRSTEGIAEMHEKKFLHRNSLTHLYNLKYFT